MISYSNSKLRLDFEFENNKKESPYINSKLEYNYNINEFFQNILGTNKSAEYAGNKSNIFYNNSKIYEAYTGEEDLELDNNDIRDAEQRIYQAENRINETEKRIYQNNKDLETRIDKNFDDLKNILKDYKKDIREEIKVHNDHNEGHIKRIEESISKLESRMDSTNKWIIGLCISTIIGIAAMTITIMIAK